MTPNTDALPPLPDSLIDELWHQYGGVDLPGWIHSFGQACARAALAAQQGAQVPQWQPIETAPRKDQMRALVAWPIDAGGGYVEEAWFDLARDQWWPANTDYTDSHGSPLYPSHWMPLPLPPSASPQAPAHATGFAEREGCDYIAPIGKHCRKCGHVHGQRYTFWTGDGEAAMQPDPNGNWLWIGDPAKAPKGL